MKKLFTLADRFQRKLAVEEDPFKGVEVIQRRLREEEIPPIQPPESLEGPETEREPGGSAAWQTEGKPVTIAGALFTNLAYTLMHLQRLNGFIASLDETMPSEALIPALNKVVAQQQDLEPLIDELFEITNAIGSGKRIIRILVEEGN